MADRADKAATDVLSTVDLFEDFTRKELTLLRGSAREESFQPGDVIVREGAPDKRFYVLLEGSAEVSSNGRVLRVFTDGASFGEIGVLDGGPRTATVTAVTPVRALSLASFTLRALMKDHPTIAIKLLEVLAARVRALAGTGIG